TGNITAGQQMAFGFDAPAGLPVYFDSQDRNNDPVTVDFRDPDGGLVFSTNASNDVGRIVLPRSRTYTLTVRGNSAASTGDLGFRLLNLLSDTVPIAFNTTVSSVLSPQYQSAVFRFDTTPGRRLVFDSLTAADTNTKVELFNAAGTSVFSTESQNDT